MRGYLQASYQVVIEASASEVMGGLVIGLILSLIASGACLLARKRVTDPLPVFCGLILFVSVLSMSVGVGYSRIKADRAGKLVVATNPHAGHRMFPPQVGRRFGMDADLDGDGRLTPEEAVRFVKQADQAGKGWADAADIDRVHRESFEARSHQEIHPESTLRPRPDRQLGEGL